MSKGFFEYNGKQAETPRAEREQFVLMAQNKESLHQDKANAMKLKQAVMQELLNGTEPQCILYAAIKCIGHLTNDQEWKEAALTQLDKVYKDLEQQSLFADNRAIESKRLKDICVQHNDIMRRSLETRLKKLGKLQADLEKVLDTLSELERIEEQE